MVGLTTVVRIIESREITCGSISAKKRIHNFCKKAEKYDFCGFRSKMSVSREKVRLVGQFEILAQDNFFPSEVRLVGHFFF